MTIKRVFVNIMLIFLLVLTIIWCFATGKAHNIILENVAITVDGVDYPPFEAIFINFGKKPKLMLAGDVIVERVVGSDLTMQIDVVDEDDNVLESRVTSFNLTDMSAEKDAEKSVATGAQLRINVPVFYARAEKK